MKTMNPLSPAEREHIARMAKAHGGMPSYDEYTRGGVTRTNLRFPVYPDGYVDSCPPLCAGKKQHHEYLAARLGVEIRSLHATLFGVGATFEGVTWWLQPHVGELPLEEPDRYGHRWLGQRALKFLQDLLVREREAIAELDRHIPPAVSSSIDLTQSFAIG